MTNMKYSGSRITKIFEKVQYLTIRHDEYYLSDWGKKEPIRL